MNKFTCSTVIAGRTIVMEARAVGQDCTVLCHGGDKPHIGAVALGVPYAGARGGQSASVSLLCVQGHREGEVCCGLARKLAKGLGRVVCVQCGIHYDDADRATIAAVVAAVDALGDEVLEGWK